MNSRKFNYHVNLITFNDSQEWHLYTLNSSIQKQFIMKLSCINASHLFREALLRGETLDSW